LTDNEFSVIQFLKDVLKLTLFQLEVSLEIGIGCEASVLVVQPIDHPIAHLSGDADGIGQDDGGNPDSRELRVAHLVSFRLTMSSE
jgi:hypothetical protein